MYDDEEGAAVPVKQPTIEELARIAASYGLHATVEDLQSFQGLMAGVLASYAWLEQLVEPTLAVKYPRSPGYRRNQAITPWALGTGARRSGAHRLGPCWARPWP
jgi:amidase